MFDLPPPDVRWSVDVSPAGWLTDHLRGFGDIVNDVVPPGFDAYVRIDHVDEGVVPSDLLVVLLEVLTRHTASTGAWFCVWDGHAYLLGGRAVSQLALSSGDVTRHEGIVPLPIRRGERVRLPQRNYYLFEGWVEDAGVLLPWDISPNLWWPDDRSWCVASEIDLPWTYVGGSSTLIEELRAVVGARTVRGDDSIHSIGP